jgi:hypothetical protein
MSNKYRPKNVESSLRKIQAGLPKVLAGGKTMFFRQANQDQTAIGGVVDAALKPFDDANKAELARTNAVKAKHANEPSAEQVVKDIEKAADNTFGVNSPEYQDLGFTPPKKAAPLTADQKVAKLTKMRQTKAARGELGPGARKKTQVAPPTPPAPGTTK